MNPTVKNHSKEIIGYKAVKKDIEGYYTDGNWRSEKIRIEIGGIYSTDGDPILYERGFHFFRHFCFAINYLEPGNAILKIKSLGCIQEDSERCVTNKIEILSVEYIEDFDFSFLKKMNSGDWNSGDGYLNFFCTRTCFFLFDKEVESDDIIAFNSIDFSWFDIKTGYREAWKKCPESELEKIKKLKNFDPEKFEVITGIKVEN